MSPARLRWGLLACGLVLVGNAEGSPERLRVDGEKTVKVAQERPEDE
jgi:hypothetical protein